MCRTRNYSDYFSGISTGEAKNNIYWVAEKNVFKPP